MNPDLNRLQPYPFQRLNELLSGVTPNPEFAPINLSIGEPKHRPPGFVIEDLIGHLNGLGSYPLTKGIPELRNAIADWLIRRFNLKTGSIDPELHLLPVAGTREALFACAQAMIDRVMELRETLPRHGDEELAARLVVLDHEIACAVLAERLDHLRHLHLSPVTAESRCIWREACVVWSPMAGRTLPDLARRYEWWTRKFTGRYS